MAGFEVVGVKTDADGNIDVADLRARAEEHAHDLAAGEAVIRRGEVRRHHGGQRTHPHDERGDASRNVKLCPRDEEEGSHRVEQAHGDDDEPVAQGRWQRVLPPPDEHRDGQEGDGDTDHHQPQGAGLVNGEFDREESRTPDCPKQHNLEQVDDCRMA